LAALNNVDQHQKQDDCRETGSGNILGCATYTCEIVVLIHKHAVLTNTVMLLSTSTDIDRHMKQDMAINKLTNRKWCILNYMTDMSNLFSVMTSQQPHQH